MIGFDCRISAFIQRVPLSHFVKSLQVVPPKRRVLPANVPIGATPKKPTCFLVHRPTALFSPKLGFSDLVVNRLGELLGLGPSTVDRLPVKPTEADPNLRCEKHDPLDRLREHDNLCQIIKAHLSIGEELVPIIVGQGLSGMLEVYKPKTLLDFQDGVQVAHEQVRVAIWSDGLSRDAE